MIHRTLRTGPLLASLLGALSACAPAARQASSGQPRPAPVRAPGTLPAAAIPESAAGAVSLPVTPERFDEALRRSISAAGAALGLDDSARAASAAALAVGAAGTDAAEEAVSWDIDVTSYASNDRVTHYLGLFTGAARDRMQARLQRGRAFEPMIRARFRAAGIPEDMYYLALVESGFDPHAYSRAAAVGMWQFMTSTARGFGLRVDWWVDERRDPARATDAAARFINVLQRQFGSYYLAAAAYNGGPGRVSRGLSRFAEEVADAEGDDRFFALAEQNYLKPETKNYVPQLIAAALIGKEPRRYGINLGEAEPYSYDSVRAPGLTPLAAVAAATGSATAVVRDLNGHVLRGATPPGDSSWVKVPPGSHHDFEARFAGLADSLRVGFARVKTRKGQTIATIARSHRLPARTLQSFNRGLRVSGSRLVPGQSVLVPTPIVVAAARDVPDPAIERYGTSAAGRTVHLVRRGESLGSIARRYRTTVNTLVRLNGLKRSVIYPGQRLVVKGSRSATRTPTATRSRPKVNASKSP